MDNSTWHINEKMGFENPGLKFMGWKLRQIYRTQMLGGGAGRVPSGSAKTPRARLLLLPCQLLPRQWRWASNSCQHYSSIDSLTSAISHHILCNLGRIHNTWHLFGGWLKQLLRRFQTLSQIYHPTHNKLLVIGAHQDSSYEVNWILDHVVLVQY